MIRSASPDVARPVRNMMRQRPPGVNGSAIMEPIDAVRQSQAPRRSAQRPQFVPISEDTIHEKYDRGTPGTERELLQKAKRAMATTPAYAQSSSAELVGEPTRIRGKGQIIGKWTCWTMINTAFIIVALVLLIIVLVTNERHIHETRSENSRYIRNPLVVSLSPANETSYNQAVYEFVLRGKAKTFNRYPSRIPEIKAIASKTLPKESTESAESNTLSVAGEGELDDDAIFKELQWGEVMPHDCCCFMRTDSGEFYFCAQGKSVAMNLGLECVLKKNPNGKGMYLLVYHEHESMEGSKCMLRWKP